MGVGWGHMSGVEYVAAFGGITPGGMMEQGKTAISKSVTGSVTRGREPGPTYLAWMGGRGEPFGFLCWELPTT